MTTQDGPHLPDDRTLFDSAPCGLLLTGADGSIRRANQTFCVWLGRTQAEFLGVKLQSMFTMGSRIFHQTHWAPLMQIQGSVAELKLEVLHPSGRTIPMVFNAVRRVHEGDVVHEVAAFVAEDRNQYERELLAQRRRAEELLRKEREAQRALALVQERLRLAFDSARMYLWDLDPARRSPRFEDKVGLLLGHPEPTPVSEAAFVAAVHPDDLAAHRAALDEALDCDVGQYSAVVRLRGIDGACRTVRASGRSFFDAAGELEHFVGVLHDVSDFARQKAEAEDRALFAEQMIGIVSHDLRNPLSAIQAGASLLRRTDPSPKQARVVELLTSSTGRASRMIEDLLDFTQARVGRGLKVTARPVNIHTVAGDSVEEMRLAHPGRPIEHVAEGASDVMADGDRLAQVIGNLVANALTYGDAGRPVTVTSSCGDGVFEVSVHNEGPAIPSALLPTLFEAMMRGEQGGSARRNVGLGLFIVREIARAHGGDVTVQSSEADGTRFCFRAPAALVACA